MKWPLIKLGDVCRVTPGFAFKSADFTPQGIPVVKIANITDNYAVDLTDAECWPNELFTEKLSKFLLQDGDILLAMTGATAGKLGRVRSDQPLLLNQRVAKIEAFEADPDFIWFSLSSQKYRERFYNLAGGAAQPNMSGGQIEAVEIPLPPRPAQQRIGSILSAYDDLIENNRRRMGLLEEAARQLYREWFVRLRFPGHEHTRITSGVPEGWEKTNALEAMSVLSGGTPKTTVADYWDGEIPFYTPKDASDQCYVLETERSITEVGLKNCNSRLHSTDTVFISARGTVGKLNLAYRPMAMSQSCYALVGKGHVPQFFLYCALQESIEYLKQHAVGAVFDAIVVDTFKLIPFMVPDGKTVRMFEESVAPMFRQVGNLLEQNQKLRAARNLLLPRLMSGEIAV
jgi:type I restriction enzyme S subunit